MKQILLIEDDPFLVEIYTAKLKKAGFQVVAAGDGEEGIRKMKEKTPDLLLLDIVLPSLNGWEILRNIKKDSKLSNVKVVILSNLGEREEIEKGLKLGAVRYLVKAHYTPGEVVEEIKKILK